MTIKEVALDLYPAWIMGLIMLYLVGRSKYSNILRVDKKGLFNFAKFMIGVTLFRLIVIKLLSSPAQLANIHHLAYYLPWQVCFGVFWEDMCHAVPLVLMGLMYGKRSWYKFAGPALLGLVMFSFGSGHVYQGVWSAVGISLYIPFTIKYGKKYGFGTVMLCHMLYDLTTILSLRLIGG
jgi:hypothetical protein